MRTSDPRASRWRNHGLPAAATIAFAILAGGFFLAPEPFGLGEGRLAAELCAVALASVFLGALLHLALQRPARLRAALAAQEQEIASANAALRRQDTLIDSLFEHLPAALILKSADDLRVVRSNRYAEAIFGGAGSELAGQPLVLGEADRQAVGTQEPVHLIDFALPAADGERRLNVHKIPLLDAAGRSEYVLEIGEDITERAHLATSVERQVHVLEQLIDSIPAPLFLKDTSGRYLNINSAFERFHGRARADVIGATIFDLAPRPLAEIYARADAALLRDGGTRVEESAMASADGSVHDVVVHTAVFRDAAGELGGIVGVMLDISERAAAARHIGQLNRTFAVLSGINEAIVRTRTRPALLERACEILVERGQFPLAWIFAAAPGEHAPRIEAVKGTPAALAHRTVDLLAACPQGCRLPAGGAAQLRHCTAESCPNSRLFAGAHGLRSLAILPLTRAGHCSGGVGIFSESADIFTAQETKLLSDLADDLSHALEAIDQEERRRLAEENLRLAARVFENSSEGIMITDARNQILAVNKTFSAVTGYAPAEVIGENPRLLSSGKQDRAFYREMWSAIQKRGEWHGEVQNRRKNGEFYSEWLTISAVRNDQGAITNYVAVFSDITSNKQIEERLNFLANYDTLTALPNRVLFTDRLEQGIAKARADGKCVAVLFLDLDRFNLINETFGHSAGDRVLQEVSLRLQASVGKKDSVSRMGGDEFAVILADLGAPDDAAPVASKIMQALSQKLVLDGRELYISASIGISVFPDDGEDVETLVKNADSAIYRAMEEGHNTFRFYHQEMNARSAERMSLESDLRHALDRGELAMHYQPFVDARSGRIVGAEALLRWHRPGIGFITPAAFIPLLEETGLIIPVGEWVLRTACADNQRWREHGFADLFVAVNFSALQLADDGIARKLNATLEAIGFDPRHLEIELTESMVMRDAERGIRTLNQFKEIGTQLSVDDFGTGYSSLSYLKRLPIDTLKIDRSFIEDTPHETEANAIVQAIIAMGHSLSLKIIAEGTQSEGQVEFLRRARCDLLQGFFFSPAVSHDEFIELLRQPPAGCRKIDGSGAHRAGLI